MQKIELLLGIGNFAGAIAAVKNEANAVYFGIKGYNMRDLGTNFSVKDLKKLMNYLHENNVKGYLALNTIIFEEELKKVESIIKKSKIAKVDALIVSDLGVMALAKKHKMELHISTQASISNSLSLEQYKKIGAKRVVLARELSLEQIKKIVKKAKKLKIEIEVFVHGAMCISVSGRCFLSHELFGRSANRGECLQPCRRAFSLSGKSLGKNANARAFSLSGKSLGKNANARAFFPKEKTLGKNESATSAFFLDGDKPNYEEKELLIQGDTILSAKDMKTIEFLDKIIATGVVSLKVEGRTKPNDYVATVARCYSEAINAIEKKQFTKTKIKKWNEELGKVYNRKFSDGFYLKKPDKKDVTDIQGSNQTTKRIHVGTVKKYYAKINVAEIKLIDCIKLNDQLIVEGKNTFIEQELSSMQINHEEIKSAKKGALVGIKFNDRVRVNDLLFKIVERKK